MPSSKHKLGLASSIKSMPLVISHAVSSNAVGILCTAVLIYCLVTSLAPAPIGALEHTSTAPCNEGLSWCICPREAVCATSILEIVFLVIARGSIYAVYPFILLMYLTKARHLSATLQKSVLSAYFDFNDIHKIHQIGGKIVEIATWIHVLFHLIRWGVRGDIGLLRNHITGQTGLVAIIILPLITWPMSFKFIKDRLSFEYRKAMHYLSWIWGLAIVFHAPAVNIFWVVGSALVVYFVDWLLSTFKYSYLIESTMFRKLGGSTLLSFTNPTGFKLESASYVLVMLPWLSNTQWHAFSIFPHPRLENTSSVCMSAAGDWTSELRKVIERPTVRPAWICGPFLSPFSTALNYDNIITIASGIGITPALAVLDRYKNLRRINLIWSCRDASLIEFFINMVQFPDDSYIFIFYTGKDPLSLGDDAPPNVFVFRGRPDLEKVIIGMIYRIEQHVLLPEEIVKEGQHFRGMSSEEKGEYLITRLANNYDTSEFYDAAAVEIPKHMLFLQGKKDSKVEPTIRRGTGPSSMPGLTNDTFRRTSIDANIADIPQFGNGRSGSLLARNLESFRGKSALGGSFRSSADIRKQDRPLGRAFSTRFLGAREPAKEMNKRSMSISVSPDMLPFKNPRKSVLMDRMMIGTFGVTFESFSDTVQDFFGNITYTPEDLTKVFSKIDKNGQGFVNEEDFLDYFDDFLLKKDDSDNTDEEKGLSNNIAWIADSHRKHKSINTSQTNRFRKSDFLSQKNANGKDLDKEKEKLFKVQRDFVSEEIEVVKTWEMLYCGGSGAIVKQLNIISDKFGIDLNIEKFDW